MGNITTRKDLARTLATNLGMTIASSEIFISQLFGHIATEVDAGNDVRIHEFGTFKRKDRPERQGRNPATGKAMTIKASSSINFKQAKHAAK